MRIRPPKNGALSGRRNYLDNGMTCGRHMVRMEEYKYVTARVSWGTNIEGADRCVGTVVMARTRKRGKAARRDEKGKKGGRIYPQIMRANERVDKYIFTLDTRNRDEEGAVMPTALDSSQYRVCTVP